MTKILIKKVSRPGVDAELFRAYQDDGAEPSARTTLKVSASCTGGTEFGAIRCAAKAFAKYTEPGGDVTEIESRIKLTADKNIDDLWIAELQGRADGHQSNMSAMSNKNKVGAASMDGAALISAERNRQKDVEGYDPAHDDQHQTNELLQAAAVYMAEAAAYPIGCEDAIWPWDDASFKHQAGFEVRSLVKAGALIAAEIDRLQRLEKDSE